MDAPWKEGSDEFLDEELREQQEHEKQVAEAWKKKQRKCFMGFCGAPILLIAIGLLTGAIKIAPPPAKTCADTTVGLPPDKWSTVCNARAECCFDVR